MLVYDFVFVLFKYRAKQQLKYADFQFQPIFDHHGSPSVFFEFFFSQIKQPEKTYRNQEKELYGSAKKHKTTHTQLLYLNKYNTMETKTIFGR